MYQNFSRDREIEGNFILSSPPQESEGETPMSLREKDDVYEQHPNTTEQHNNFEGIKTFREQC